MHIKCSAPKCGSLFNTLSFSYDCKKKGKCLYEDYDYRLVELIGETRDENKTIDEHELSEVSREIQDSYLNLSSRVNAIHDIDALFPKTADEFNRTFLQIHSSIFSSLSGKTNGFVGKLRTEPIEVGSGKNKITCVDHNEILKENGKAYDELVVSIDFKTCSKPDFARKCAIFMERMFTIHPFLDGNGRTVRFFLMLIAKKTERWKFSFQEIHNGTDSDYIKAIEECRKKRYDKNGRIDREKSYKRLIKWLTDRLVNEKEETLEEVEKK